MQRRKQNRTALNNDINPRFFRTGDYAIYKFALISVLSSQNLDVPNACEVENSETEMILRYKKPLYAVVYILWLLAAIAATHVAAPVIYAYFFSEWWYRIVICAVAAFVGTLLGTRIYKVKHK